jgi:hypothetical protein
MTLFQSARITQPKSVHPANSAARIYVTPDMFSARQANVTCRRIRDNKDLTITEHSAKTEILKNHHDPFDTVFQNNSNPENHP